MWRNPLSSSSKSISMQFEYRKGKHWVRKISDCPNSEDCTSNFSRTLGRKNTPHSGCILFKLCTLHTKFLMPVSQPLEAEMKTGISQAPIKRNALKGGGIVPPRFPFAINPFRPRFIRNEPVVSPSLGRQDACQSADHSQQTAGLTLYHPPVSGARWAKSISDSTTVRQLFAPTQWSPPIAST